MIRTLLSVATVLTVVCAVGYWVLMLYAGGELSALGREQRVRRTFLQALFPLPLPGSRAHYTPRGWTLVRRARVLFWCVVACGFFIALTLPRLQ